MWEETGKPYRISCTSPDIYDAITLGKVPMYLQNVKEVELVDRDRVPVKKYNQIIKMLTDQGIKIIKGATGRESSPKFTDFNESTNMEKPYKLSCMGSDLDDAITLNKVPAYLQNVKEIELIDWDRVPVKKYNQICKFLHDLGIKVTNGASGREPSKLEELDPDKPVGYVIAGKINPTRNDKVFIAAAPVRVVDYASADKFSTLRDARISAYSIFKYIKGDTAFIIDLGTMNCVERIVVRPDGTIEHDFCQPGVENLE